MLLQENPFASEEITPPFSEEWAAKRRVTRAIQQLTEMLVTSSPGIDEMHDIACKLESAAADFGASPRIHGRLKWAKSGEHGNFGQVSHELNPLAGLSNPLAPPVAAWIDGELARGRCQCGWAYEGPPGCVHGGFVAAIFDQFLGVAQQLGPQAGMTGFLHLNYHAPTPLNTELELVGRLVKVDGRKTTMGGEMFANGVLTATAEGLFIVPRQGGRI